MPFHTAENTKYLTQKHTSSPQAEHEACGTALQSTVWVEAGRGLACSAVGVLNTNEGRYGHCFRSADTCALSCIALHATQSATAQTGGDSQPLPQPS